jgi:hypothetical protein
LRPQVGVDGEHDELVAAVAGRGSVSRTEVDQASRSPQQFVMAAGLGDVQDLNVHVQDHQADQYDPPLISR